MKALQIFCALNKCDMVLKNGESLLKRMVTKKKRKVWTNKNVTKMDLIIKRVYCNQLFSYLSTYM